MSKIIHPAAAATLCLAILSMTSLVAGPPGRNKSARSEPTGAHAVPRQTGAGSSTSISFSLDHVQVIRQHYAPRYRQLPPGLQKKYARTGQLPPGWQKKMEPLPPAIEARMPALPDGYRRGVIDGHAVIYSSRAGTIIDVAVLF